MESLGRDKKDVYVLNIYIFVGACNYLRTDDRSEMEFRQACCHCHFRDDHGSLEVIEETCDIGGPCRKRRGVGRG